MAHNIDLSKPLLEQQSVRELLNISTEEIDPKISLENLMRIAQTVIKSELMDAGHSEQKSLSIRLECNSSEYAESKASEQLSLKWDQSTHKEETEARGNDSFETFSIPQETVKNLIDRLSETLATNSSHHTISSLSFQFVGIGARADCCWAKNGDPYHVYPGGDCDFTRLGCGTSPERLPDD